MSTVIRRGHDLLTTPNPNRVHLMLCKGIYTALSWTGPTGSPYIPPRGEQHISRLGEFCIRIPLIGRAGNKGSILFSTAKHESKMNAPREIKAYSQLVRHFLHLFNGFLERRVAWNRQGITCSIGSQMEIKPGPL